MLSITRLTAFILLFGWLTLGSPNAGSGQSSVQDSAQAAHIQPDIEAFVREGCPHCAKAELFLTQLKQEHQALNIVMQDVSKAPAALER